MADKHGDKGTAVPALNFGSTGDGKTGLLGNGGGAPFANLFGAAAGSGSGFPATGSLFGGSTPAADGKVGGTPAVPAFPNLGLKKEDGKTEDSKESAGLSPKGGGIQFKGFPKSGSESETDSPKSGGIQFHGFSNPDSESETDDGTDAGAGAGAGAVPTPSIPARATSSAGPAAMPVATAASNVSTVAAQAGAVDEAGSDSDSDSDSDDEEDQEAETVLLQSWRDKHPRSLVATARDELSKLYIWMPPASKSATSPYSAHPQSTLKTGTLRVITLEGSEGSVGNGSSPLPEDLVCHPALPPTEDRGVETLLINSTGTRAAVCGRNFVRVMYLEMPEDSVSGKRKTAAVGAYHNHYTADGVADVKWHPLAPTCLVVLNSDGKLRFYDTGGRFKLQIADCMPHFDFKVGPDPLRASKKEMQDEPAVSFGFGRTSGANPSILWETFAVFVAHKDGGMNVLCPVVPIGSRFTPTLLPSLRRDKTAIDWLDAFEETLDLRGKPLLYAQKHIKEAEERFGGHVSTVHASIQRDLGHGAGLQDAKDFIDAIQKSEEVEWTEGGRPVIIPRTVLKPMQGVSLQPMLQRAGKQNGIDADYHDLLVLSTEPQPTFVVAGASQNAVNISMLAQPVIPFFGADSTSKSANDGIVETVGMVFTGEADTPLCVADGAKHSSPCKLAHGDPANTKHFFAYTRKRCKSIDLWKPLQTLSLEVGNNSQGPVPVECSDDTIGRVVAAPGDIFGVAVLRQRRRNCRVVVSGTDGTAASLSVDAIRHSYQSSAGPDRAYGGARGAVVSPDAGPERIERIDQCQKRFLELKEKAEEDIAWESGTALPDALDAISKQDPKTKEYIEQLPKVLNAFKKLFGDAQLAPRKQLEAMNNTLEEWARVVEAESSKDKERVAVDGDLSVQIQELELKQKRLEEFQKTKVKEMQSMSKFLEMLVARLHAVNAGMSADNSFKEAFQLKQAEHARLKARVASLQQQRSVVQAEGTERIQVEDCCAMDTASYTGRKISRLFLFARPGDVLAYDLVSQQSASSYKASDAATAPKISMCPADIRIAPKTHDFALVANGGGVEAGLGAGTVAVLDLRRITTHGLSTEGLAVTSTMDGFEKPVAIAVDPKNEAFALVADAGKKEILSVQIDRSHTLSGPKSVHCSDGTPAGVAIVPNREKYPGKLTIVVAQGRSIDLVTVDIVKGGPATMEWSCCMSESTYIPRSIVVHPDCMSAFFTCESSEAGVAGTGRLAQLSLRPTKPVRSASGARDIERVPDFERFVSFTNPTTVTLSKGRVFVVEQSHVTNIELYSPSTSSRNEQTEVLERYERELQSDKKKVEAKIQGLNMAVQAAKRKGRSNADDNGSVAQEPLHHEM